MQVEREGNQAKKVLIRVDGMSISFCFQDGKVIETSRARMDGARIAQESLWIPPVQYSKVLRTAHAIFKGKRRSS